jgi:hypothetical protein
MLPASTIPGPWPPPGTLARTDRTVELAVHAALRVALERRQARRVGDVRGNKLAVVRYPMAGSSVRQDRGRRRTPRRFILGLHRRRSDSSTLDCGGDVLLWAKGRASPLLRASNTILLARRTALEVGLVSAGLRHRSAQILNDETSFVPATYRDHDLSCDCRSRAAASEVAGSRL